MSKVISDAVFGFIRIPDGLLFQIVQHPAFYRLSRIRQLGGANVVYPGAQHTRFQHSLGAFHLTSLATRSLMRKGNFIFDSEEEAVLAAILLHDIGHGPFSHVLEHTLVRGVSHEQISLLIMQRLNEEMRGMLTLAIKIFKDEYGKRFLHQLISSQLDMDRLDYLRRDSFYTGVTEGNIGSARIIEMLNVVEDQLVVEKKGIYSIENYLVARRLMYWQVYLHKTAVAAELVLINAMKRAKHLVQRGISVSCSAPLHFFLEQEIGLEAFNSDPKVLDNYLELDDNDILSALKAWRHHEDPILALLADDYINRRIFRVEVSEEPFPETLVAERINDISQALGLPESDVAEYLVAQRNVGTNMYNPNDDHIQLLQKDGTIADVTTQSDMLNLQTLSHQVQKNYLCYQRI